MHPYLATLLIVWHSRTSASEQLAQAATQGAHAAELGGLLAAQLALSLG